MSDFEQVALHFYHEIKPQVVGKVGSSFQRQHKSILNNIEQVIQKYGAEVAAAQLRGLANYSQVYDGRNNPAMEDVFNSMHEMSEAGIAPDTQEWREQIQLMGDRNLIRTATVDENGDTKVFDNATPNTETEAAHPLNEALAYQRTQLKNAMADRDENAIARTENIIKLIERDIQSLNGSNVPDPSAPDKPVLSPEAKARQEAADKDVRDSIARHDARVAAEAAERDDADDYIDPYAEDAA